MFKALRYGAIAIGGYLVISTAVHIVDSTADAPPDVAAAVTSTTTASMAVPAVATAPATTVVALSAPTLPPAADAVVPELAAAEPVVSVDPTPTAIERLEAMAGGPTSAAAGWTAITGAEYELELLGPDGGQVHAFRTTATQWAMEGLLPGSAYLVRVRPVDPATGTTGPWAEALFATSSRPG